MKRYVFLAATLAACGGGVEKLDVGTSSYDAWKRSVPVESGTGFFIVDGDHAVLDDGALREFYAANVASTLIVQTNSSGDRIWSASQRDELTYCVSDAFGENRLEVVRAMDTAALAWESAAPVHFTHLSGEDEACDRFNNNILFDVSPAAYSASYYARSFFPGDPRSVRSILIRPDVFTELYGFSTAGLMRHELGHVVGFAHEHYRPEGDTGCGTSENWRELTGYDPLSVMHYPWCGGTGADDFELTEFDELGAACAYDANTCEWEPLAGGATDIAVGANGQAWAIGEGTASGGKTIHRYSAATGAWTLISGGAVRIAVSPAGVPWIINSQHEIFRRVGSAWEQMPGAGRDIGIGANGSVWIIGNGATSGGYGVHRYEPTTNSWTQVTGGGVRISVDPNGNPWIVNNIGRIYRRELSNFVVLPGAAYDVGIDGSGNAFIIGRTVTSGGWSIHRWNPVSDNWQRLSGGAVAISGGDDQPWVANSDGEIFRNRWQ